MSVLDKRLVVVTGKGGVGKTTVAAALGRSSFFQVLTAAAPELAELVMIELAERVELLPLG